MATVMGIAAKNKNVELRGMRVAMKSICQRTFLAATPVGPPPVQRVVASANKTESSKDGNTGWMSRFGS